MRKIAELIYKKTEEENSISQQIRHKNKEYKRLDERLVNLHNQLFSGLSEENKKLFLEYDSLVTSLSAIELREYFIAGYNQGINSF